MNERLKKLKAACYPDRVPLCADHAFLAMESFKETEYEPPIIRHAKAHAHIFDNCTIFIEDGELIVGNPASKPNGAEIMLFSGPMPDDEIELLQQDVAVLITDEERAKIKILDEYSKGKIFSKRIWQKLNERVRMVMKTGVNLPPWTEERGYGAAFAVTGMGPEAQPVGAVLDYEKVLNQGVNAIIKEAKKELEENINNRFTNIDSIKKSDFLKAVIIANEAFIRWANRFAILADEMASKEKDPVRKKELEKIAATCRWVPANPARDFREAMQSFWFTFLAVQPTGLGTIGRFDQFMYPFYKKDIEEKKITDDEVLELLECLRFKDMQTPQLMVSAGYRKKYSGMAKWHNMVIGGVTPDGKDATNELTYLILEAAKDAHTIHHTITLRVHEKTPEALMLKAVDVVSTGIGMPAFIGDKGFIATIGSRGIPLEVARDYAPVGCLAPYLKGQSVQMSVLGVTAALVFDFFVHKGIEPRTGKPIGPHVRDFESYESFDDLKEAYKEYLAYFVGTVGEAANVWTVVQQEIGLPFASALMFNGIKEGKSITEIAWQLDWSSGILCTGMINVADSLAAIKKLVFEEKKVTLKELKAALDANWQGNGYADMRKMFLAAPKYGNNDDYVDSIASEFYEFFTDKVAALDNIYGGKFYTCGVNASNQWPAGMLTGATPDGRYAGEALADGSMSAMRGRDYKGPTAVMNSALKINQFKINDPLMNMKFDPQSLKSTEDKKKLASLIKAYFIQGGKHVQFNVVSMDTLIDAQKHPEKYRDLIVRVAAYSAYFIQLSKNVQDEIMGRTYQVWD